MCVDTCILYIHMFVDVIYDVYSYIGRKLLYLWRIWYRNPAFTTGVQSSTSLGRLIRRWLIASDSNDPHELYIYPYKMVLPQIQVGL